MSFSGHNNPGEKGNWENIKRQYPSHIYFQ